MKRTTLIFLFVILALYALAPAAGGAPAAPLTPLVVSYQGHVLVDQKPYAGTGYFKFAIVDGAGTTRWSNDGTDGEPTGYVALQVTNGLFDVLLGNPALGMIALSDEAFRAPERYLRVWFTSNLVSGFAWLKPDRPVAATPYAFISQEAAHAATADYAINNWRLLGNAGTTPGTNYIGTADNQALELKVNGTRALRLAPNATAPNLVGGHNTNEVTAGVAGAAIGGGGGSAVANRITDNFGTVSGGQGNRAGDASGTLLDAEYASVGGGYGNFAGGAYATVPGGQGNSASGDYSLAAGRYATAFDEGCFVWGDSNPIYLQCFDPDRWLARASGGVYFYTDPNATVGVYVAAGGTTWSSISDRATKENFTPVDGAELLSRLAAMPVQEYNLKTQDSNIRHIGPVAQDFAAFGYGESTTAINSQDADGVALAAIQALHEQLQALRAQNEAQQKQIEALATRLTAAERAQQTAEGRQK